MTDFNMPDYPASRKTLSLGMLSLATMICYGLPGFIFGIIGWVLAGKSLSKKPLQPEHYSPRSIRQFRRGFSLIKIGTILSGIYLLFILSILILKASGSNFISIFPWETISL